MGGFHFTWRINNALIIVLETEVLVSINLRACVCVCVYLCNRNG